MSERDIGGHTADLDQGSVIDQNIEQNQNQQMNDLLLQVLYSLRWIMICELNEKINKIHTINVIKTKSFLHCRSRSSRKNTGGTRDDENNGILRL